MKASAIPAAMTITGGDSIVLTNILVGEVWLASGQSNMEKPVGDQPGQRPCVNASAELAGANYPHIRLFKVDKGTKSSQPLEKLKRYQSWRECSSNSLDGMSFSAAGYFFAQTIHTNLGVPVGIIESSWGGTRIEPWTPAVGFASVPTVAGYGRPQIGTNEITAAQPMTLYNAMIAPLVPFAIRGVLWYQGESNLMGETNHLIYTDKMEALVNGWRKVWREGNFPFYYVQIAPYRYSERKQVPVITPDGLPVFWEAQRRALRIRDTGMVVIYDTVDNYGDIHPTHKREVGERLALLALANDYHRNVISSGPTFRSVRFSKGKAVVRFDHADGGLMTRDGHAPTSFEIAGDEGKFVPADAVIDGQTVILSNAEVPSPKRVRFGWSETANPNLINPARLPARQFNSEF